LRRIAVRYGLTLNDVLSEIDNRIRLLRDLKQRGIRKNVDLAKFITNYYVEAQFPRIQEPKRTKVQD